MNAELKRLNQFPLAMLMCGLNLLQFLTNPALRYRPPPLQQSCTQPLIARSFTVFELGTDIDIWSI